MHCFALFWDLRFFSFSVFEHPNNDHRINVEGGPALFKKKKNRDNVLMGTECQIVVYVGQCAIMDPRIVNSSRKGYKTNKCMYPVYTVLERRRVRMHTAVQCKLYVPLSTFRKWLCCARLENGHA